MPAGETPAPRALPFHLALLVRRRELPQREVGRVLLLAEIDALAGLEPSLVQAREVAVIGLLAGVEVDAVGSTICVAVFLDVGDELDLLADMVGGAAENRRLLDVERTHVIEERAGIKLGDFPRGLASA